MSLDTTVPRSRRALLGAAVGAAVATVASALGRPSPALAGIDGDVVLGQSNSAAASTSLTADLAQGVTLVAYNTSTTTPNAAFGAQSNYGTAILASTWEGKAVIAGLGGTSGTALLASAPSGGTALDVVGKAKFSRSGRVLMAKGRYYVDVAPKGGLTGTPLCFATLTVYRAGYSVAAVRPNWPSSGRLRIYLNKALTSSTYVAWVVIG